MAFSETDLAYAAGLLDGEGCILIWRLNGGRGPSPEYAMRVTVSNNVKTIAEWLKERFGGNISFRAQAPRKYITYHWNVSARQAIKFLEAVRSYSLIKQDQILLALEFAKTLHSSGGRTPLPQSIRNQRDMLRTALQLAKKRPYTLCTEEV